MESFTIVVFAIVSLSQDTQPTSNDSNTLLYRAVSNKMGFIIKDLAISIIILLSVISIAANI